MISEIIQGGLYIGTIHDAIYDKREWGLIICVAEWDNFTDEERNDLMVQNRAVLHVPFMVYEQGDGLFQHCRADLRKLDLVSAAIKMGISTGPVLVHCAAGRERSPLAVIWYLCGGNFLKIDDAYEEVKQKRPIIEDRRSWLWRR